MPSDTELYIEYKRTAGRVGVRRAARELAAIYGLSPDSVSGRLSRASNQPATRLAAARALCVELPKFSPSIQRQDDVIKRSIDAFNTHQNTLAGKMNYAVFASDVHLPYARWDAIDLLIQIVSYVQPAYVTAFNDMYDMMGYGRWPDTRTARARLWSQDITTAMQAGAEFLGAIKAVAPSLKFLGIRGNHDNWLLNYLRTLGDGMSEKNIADWMEFFEQQGVIQFGRDENTQDVVQLAPNLVYTHGWYAQRNPLSISQETIRQVQLQLDTRTAPDVVTGHTHRAFVNRIGNATHYSSGTLSRLRPPYQRTLSNWQLGIVVSRFDPESQDTSSELVEFYRERDKLIARYGGVIFDTPFDDTTPQDNI